MEQKSNQLARQNKINSATSAEEENVIYIDDKPYDRLLYDLLKFEFKNGTKNED